MKVIFLDFDGVLNNHAFFLTSKFCSETVQYGTIEYMKQNTDPWNVRNLKIIHDYIPDLHFVISSTWRKFCKIETFNNFFEGNGFKKNIVHGMTPLRLSSDMSSRSFEIDSYLEVHKIENYFILDDHTICREDEPNYSRFLQVDQRNGLTYADACYTINKLDKNWREPLILL